LIHSNLASLEAMKDEDYDDLPGLEKPYSDEPDDPPEPHTDNPPVRKDTEELRRVKAALIALASALSPPWGVSLTTIL
jgi:hypothetical protein